MNCKTIFTVRLMQLRDSLRHRSTRISSTVIPTVVMSVMLFGMGKIMSQLMTTPCEEDPVVIVGLWPLFGIGPLHFMFIR